MLLIIILYVLIIIWYIYDVISDGVTVVKNYDKECEHRAPIRQHTTHITNVTYMNIDKAIIMKGDENGSNNPGTIRRN